MEYTGVQGQGIAGDMIGELLMARQPSKRKQADTWNIVQDPDMEFVDRPRVEIDFCNRTGYNIMGYNHEQFDGLN